MESDSGVDFEDGVRSDDRLASSSYRRKGISHFDCTSAGTSLSEVLFVGANRSSFSTGNTKTGASLAQNSVASRTDVGNEASLVLEAPHFRTELGYDRPLEERHLSLGSTPFAGLLLEPVNWSEQDAADAERYKFSELRLCRPEARNQKCLVPCRFEFIDHGARYYRQFFADNEHQNFFGVDDQHGPMAVSLRRETCSVGQATSSESVSTDHDSQSILYRVIVRTPQVEVLRCSVLEDSINVEGARPKSGAMSAKDVLQYVCPKLPTASLRLGQQSPKVMERLLRLDEQSQSRTFKFGVMLCREGQSSEEEMYNNECTSPAFDKFLRSIGDVVELEGFEKYRAQLDNKHNSTGTHSVYTRFHGNEIMLHVSTMLPYSKEGRQQLQRKRHIGNDIVTVIFQEHGALPFSPATIRSHFQHVFIVVRELPATDGETSYMVAVSSADNVPVFGPPLPAKPVFKEGEEFREFLLTKLINAEGASHRSTKFLNLTRRTRFECLSGLAEDFSSSQGLDMSSRGGRFSQALKHKKKTSNATRMPVAVATRVLPGGVMWNVRVASWGPEMTNSETAPCTLCISPTYVALLSRQRHVVLFCIQARSIIGWSTASTAEALTLYYNEGECIRFFVPGTNDSLEELDEIVLRLSAVTSGCFTQESVLRRTPDGHLGFSIHQRGLVGEVDPYGVAWKCGLRQSARILELNNALIFGQAQEAVLSQIKSSPVLSLVLAPPADNGGVRGEPLRGRWDQTVQHVTTPVSTPRIRPPSVQFSPVKEPKRYRTFDSNRLSMQKKRFDKKWVEVTTAPKSANVATVASPKTTNLKGVVEKAKKALAASGLAADASSPSRELHGGSLNSTSSLRLNGKESVDGRSSLSLSPMDSNDWSSPVSVPAHFVKNQRPPAYPSSQSGTVPYASPGFAHPLHCSSSESDREVRLDDDSLLVRLQRAESQVVRLQDELAKVHRENRLLVNLVDQLRPDDAAASLSQVRRLKSDPNSYQS